jgi:hypothetical protein
MEREVEKKHINTDRSHYYLVWEKYLPGFWPEDYEIDY